MSKISLVIPVYNVEKYINQCMDSIINQTLNDIQIICVDDGSLDNCPQILDDYAKKDNRITVIHQKNAGVSAARNAGIKIATGEYIIFPDSDDWMELDALENLWKEAEQTDADIVYGDWVEEHIDKYEYIDCFPESFYTDDEKTIKVMQCAVNCNSKLKISRPEFSWIGYVGGAPWRGIIKTSIIKNNGIFFDPYVKGLGDDVLFSLHVYEYIKSIAYIKRLTYHWRSTELSYTNGYKSDLIEIYSRIIEKMQKFIVDYEKDDRFIKSYYSKVMLYFLKSMPRYFKNSMNSKNARDRFLEMKKLLETEPYKTARKINPFLWYQSKGIRIKSLLLKYGLYKIFWIIA